MNRNVALTVLIALCLLGVLVLVRFDSRPSRDRPSSLDMAAMTKVIVARARSWKGPAAQGRPEQTAESRLAGVVRSPP